MYCFIMKNLNKSELQKMASNHLSDNDFEFFMKLCKHYIKKPLSVLVNDTHLSSENLLTFKKKLL